MANLMNCIDYKIIK